MYEDDVFILFLALIVPLFFALLLGGNGIKKSERSTREFYYILREKYPRHYVQQNKTVKFIRRLFKMDAKGKIHWMICLFHYLSIFLTISPLIMLIVFIFMQSMQVVYTFLVIGVSIPCGLYGFLYEIFNFSQACRCNKIKKTIPRYSTSEVYRWRGF